MDYVKVSQDMAKEFDFFEETMQQHILFCIIDINFLRDVEKNNAIGKKSIKLVSLSHHRSASLPSV